MALSKLSNSGTDRSAIISSLRVSDGLLVQDKSNAANWIRYNVTSTAVNNTTWFQIGIAAVTGSGTTSTNNNELVVTFETAGTPPVTSVFGRTGPVVAATADYSFAQLSGAAATTQAGLPTGGAPGQVLAKNTSTNYDTGWVAAGAGTVTSVAAGNLSPLFTTTVTNSTTTPALSFTASTAAANSFYGNNTGATGAAGFVQPTFANLSGTVTATQGGLPTGGSAGQVLKKNTGTNYDASWANDLSIATLQSGALSPAGTTDTTGKMAGLNQQITPARSGKIFVTFSGSINNSAASGSAVASIRWGTGTPPINGAALTGTSVGASAQRTGSYAANQVAPFSLSAVITGLTLGTAVWLDLQQSGTTGTANVVVAVSAYELP
jgi:hypothetical protein